jgi:hypothetical protein
MIIEQVNHDSSIQAIIRVKTASALLKQLRTAGERVYSPVEVDPLAYAVREPFSQGAFNEIAHEVAGQNLVIITGKEHVKEKVHGVAD